MTDDRDVLSGFRELRDSMTHDTRTVWKDSIDVEVCWDSCEKCRLSAAITAAEGKMGERDAAFAELEGIDKACDAANEHVLKLQADIESLRELMPCKHPRACWVEGIIVPNGQTQISTNDNGHCTACASEASEKARAVGEFRGAALDAVDKAAVELGDAPNSCPDPNYHDGVMLMFNRVSAKLAALAVPSASREGQ